MLMLYCWGLHVIWDGCAICGGAVDAVGSCTCQNPKLGIEEDIIDLPPYLSHHI